MSYVNPYSLRLSGRPPEKSEVYNSIDISLKEALDIVYPDKPSGKGLKTYLEDSNPHPVVEYLAAYSSLMGEDLAARTIANQMGMSIPDMVSDDDIYFVNSIILFLKTEAAKSNSPVTLRYVMGMNGIAYRDWEKGQTDAPEYYNRLYYVMRRYYGLKV